MSRVATVVWRDFVCDWCGADENADGHEGMGVEEAHRAGVTGTNAPWAIWCSNSRQGAQMFEALTFPGRA